LIVVGAAAAGAPSAAVAGTARVEGDTLFVGATAGSVYNGQVSVNSDVDGTYFQVSDSVAMQNGAGCTQASGSSSFSRCTATARIQFDGTNGNDAIIVNTPAPATLIGNGGDDGLTSFDGSLGRDMIDGGEGVDTVAGGKGPDTVLGGGGSDNQVRGDEGNDFVDGGEGVDRVIGGNGADLIAGGGGNDAIFGDDTFTNAPDDGVDVLDGGAGDDTLDGGFLGDTLVGGPGVDTATYEERNTDNTVAASLDNAANDGEPGENDNVGPGGDIENLTGAFAGVTTLVGNDGPNVLKGETLSASDIDGRGGDDTITGTGSNNTIRSKAKGGDGNDTITTSAGSDEVDGGAGNDQITTSSGNDTVLAGPGTDTVSAGDGNDVVNSVDGAVDQVGCGTGADVADADTSDVVNTNDPGDNCETVRRTAAPPPGAGPAPGADPTGNPNASAVQLILAGTAKISKLIRAGGFKVSAKGPGPGIFSITATIPRKDANKARIAAAKPVVIAKGKATLLKAGTVRVTVKLTKKAKRGLRRLKKTKATLTSRYSDANGKVTITRKTVSLRR